MLMQEVSDIVNGYSQTYFCEVFMDFLGYMNELNYDDDNNNCWHFVQRIFLKEKNYMLPDYPVFLAHKEFKNGLIANVEHKQHNLDECTEGFIVHITCLGHEHAGYALNNKQYIHKTRKGVQVSDIPNNAILYEIIT